MNSSGSLYLTTKDLSYPVADNTTYVMEMETTPTTTALYFYPKGQTRAQGVSHVLTSMDWRSGAETGALTICLTLGFHKMLWNSINLLQGGKGGVNLLK